MLFELFCSLPVGLFLKEKIIFFYFLFLHARLLASNLTALSGKRSSCRKLFLTSASCNLCEFGALDLGTTDSECLRNNVSYHTAYGRTEVLDEQAHLEAQRKESFVQEDSQSNHNSFSELSRSGSALCRGSV